MYMYKGISLPYKKKKKHPNTESQLYFSIKLNKSKKKKKKERKVPPRISSSGLRNWTVTPQLPGSPRVPQAELCCS